MVTDSQDPPHVLSGGGDKGTVLLALDKGGHCNFSLHVLVTGDSSIFSITLPLLMPPPFIKD